jgi:hypothetical protein
VKPEDAGSNLAAWLHWAGLHNVPAWLSDPAADHRVIAWAVGASLAYVFLIWGLPKILTGVPRQSVGMIMIFGLAQMAKAEADPGRRSEFETESRLWLQIAMTEDDLDALRKKAQSLLNAQAIQKAGRSRR